MRNLIIGLFNKKLSKAIILFLIAITIYILRPDSSKRNGIFGIFKSKNTVSDEIDLSKVLVKAKKIQLESISPSLSILGSIDYVEKIDVVSKTAANIRSIYVKEGENVRKDQIIVQMDTLQLELERRKQESGYNSALSSLKLAKEKYTKAREAIEIRLLEVEKRKTQVKETEAELIKTRSTVEGKEILFKEGGVSKEEYERFQTTLVSAEAKYRISLREWEMSLVGFRPQDLSAAGVSVPHDPNRLKEAYVDLNTRIDRAEVEVAQSQVEAAKAALQSTDELLRNATIRSPIDGIVAYVNKHVGEYVNPGGVTSSDQAILNLIGINSVYAKFSIPESEMPKIKKGLNVEFSLDVYPNNLFKGQIDLINPMIDPKTHTRDVKVKIENLEKKFNPGMFVRGTIFTGSPEMTLLVPQQAIVPKEKERAWVFEIKNGKIFRTDVKVGREIKGSIVISEGLEPDAVVAIDKLTQLKDGMLVKPDFDESL